MSRRSKYRILMFSPIFAPFGNPEAIVNNKLVLSFMEEGWHVDVITRKVPEMYGYTYGSLWENIWMPLREVTHEVDYNVGGKYRQKKEAVIDGIRMGCLIEGCRWASHAFDYSVKLHARNKYNIVISRALPDAAHLAALNFSRRMKIPWIANWNDPPGDKNPPPGGKGPEASLGFFHDRLLKNVARHAHWITFPSERMRKYMCRCLGGSILNKSSAIPHVARKWSSNSEQTKNADFTLCHAGNLYSIRNPYKLFKALKKCRDNSENGSNIIIDVIGIENVDLKETADKYGVAGSLHFTGPMTYTDTLKHLEKCDVLVVIEAPYDEGIYLPSKFVDYVQTGKPILVVSPAHSTLADILFQHGGGLAADCQSDEDIVRNLTELYSQWKNDTLEASFGSNGLYHLFSPETIIEQYREIFAKISRQ